MAELELARWRRMETLSPINKENGRIPIIRQLMLNQIIRIVSEDDINTLDEKAGKPQKYVNTHKSQQVLYQYLYPAFAFCLCF